MQFFWVVSGFREGRTSGQGNFRVAVLPVLRSLGS